jgi:hypothetical protein
MFCLKRVPFPTWSLVLSLVLTACGGSGDASPSPGTGGSDSLRFCEDDMDCAGGAANQCQAATCDLTVGVCVSEPLPEGTPCNDTAGVCRNGFCTPSELKAYVKSPNPQPSALFGTGTAIRGDRMIVGAPSSGPPFGRVAVFERSDSEEWEAIQQIVTPQLGQSCRDGLFGWTVAAADDFFVVGSLGFGLGGGGSVRVYTKSISGEWAQDSFGAQRGCLVAPDGDPFDLFATSVAITPSGDTLVVGAPGHYSGPRPSPLTERDYSGAIYIFEKVNSVDWSEGLLIKASNAGGDYECTPCDDFACPTSGEGDGFGVSVAISGTTVVVGAPGEGSAATGVNGDETDDSASGAGAAYVFDKVDDMWVQTAYLKASNTDAGDRFGFAVAIHGDTIVVGAEREDSGSPEDQDDNSAPEAGAAYVFERTGGIWEQTQYLKASNVTEGFFFGAQLTLNDTTLVIGSPGESSIGGEDSGAAYVFTLSNGAWTQTNFYKAFNADAGASFAGPIGSVAYGTPSSLVSCRVQSTTRGVSLSMDENTVIVGAPFEDSAAIGVNGVPTTSAIPDSGAVYVFENSEGQ